MGIVGHDGVARPQTLDAELLNGSGHYVNQGAKVHRLAIGLSNDPQLVIEEGTRAIQASLDVGRVR